MTTRQYNMLARILARNVRSNNMLCECNDITEVEAKIVNERMSRVISDVADVFQAYDGGFDRAAFMSTATTDMKLP